MLVTTNTANRIPIFKDAAAARTAIEILYHTQELYSFFLYAFVIMPDHCHFLLHIPQGGAISKTMNQYKRSMTFEIGREIWQPRFHLRLLQNDYEHVRTYIHLNPVRAGLSGTPEAYPWSSASGRWDIVDFLW